MNNPQPKFDAPHGAGPRLDDSSVAAYLGTHADFFERHPALLAQLRLPHPRGDGSTVSLFERQLDVLRERTRELELRMRTLIDNGHANDQLAVRLHALARRLVHARTAPERLAAVEASLREDFSVQEFVVVLTRAVPTLAALSARCLRVIAADDAGLKSFESLFSSGKPRCGRIRDTQREFLFPASDALVGSVALVPLGAGGSLGLLAIASADADHFNPTMSTDYLARIGELIATALDGSADARS